MEPMGYDRPVDLWVLYFQRHAQKVETLSQKHTKTKSNEDRTGVEQHNRHMI